MAGRLEGSWAAMDARISASYLPPIQGIVSSSAAGEGKAEFIVGLSGLQGCEAMTHNELIQYLENEVLPKQKRLVGFQRKTLSE